MNWQKLSKQAEPLLDEDDCFLGRAMAVVSMSPFPNDPRVYRAAEALADVGMRVEVICLGDNGSPKREVINGIAVDRIFLRKSRNSKWLYVLQYSLFLLIAFGKLSARSMRKRYDVVHIHNMPDILVFAAVLPKWFGAKVILDLHDPMPELMQAAYGASADSATVRLLALLEKWSTAFANVVITVNGTCRDLFASRSCSTSKVVVVMNAPDERIFNLALPQVPRRDLESKDAAFIVMYHGTAFERNGLDLAVVALIKLRQWVPNAELRIYGGRTEFLEQVMSDVADKGLEGVVRHLGPKSTEEIAAAISECDVGLIPNRRNIFTEINTPTRIFEYLALGKPVVAPRAPGICEYFTESEMHFFELGNADDLARKLHDVFHKRDEASEKTKRGQLVYLDHTWSKQRAVLRGVVRELLYLCNDCH